MQQRRLRLGDILDDYCPRERRITNHAVVAMIEDQVKQTRCTTCEAAAPEESGGEEQPVPDDDGPVHRRLIRATLPRPEGQSPERKTPEFTVRQPGGRGREFDGNRGGGGGGGGQRHGRGRRPAR